MENKNDYFLWSLRAFMDGSILLVVVILYTFITGKGVDVFLYVAMVIFLLISLIFLRRGGDIIKPDNRSAAIGIIGIYLMICAWSFYSVTVIKVLWEELWSHGIIIPPATELLANKGEELFAFGAMILMIPFLLWAITYIFRNGKI